MPKKAVNPAPDAPARRVAIFSMSDPQGIVDDYITYLLADLKQNLSQLHIVVSGALGDDGRAKLADLTDSVTRLPGGVSDIDCWWHAIRCVITADELEQADELILLNDSFFGPFVPFRLVLDEMSTRDVDFWGLLRHRAGRRHTDAGIVDTPDDIEPFFLAFRKRLLSDSQFLRFGLEPGDTDIASRFTGLGYRSGAYLADIDDIFEGNDSDVNLADAAPCWLIERKGLPVLRCQSLAAPVRDSLPTTDGMEARAALDYVKAHTDFPVRLIWQHLLRRYGASRLKESLALDLIVDPDLPEKHVTSARVGVVLAVYYEETLDEVLQYLFNLPASARVVVVTSNEALFKLIQAKFADLPAVWEVRLKPNRGRDLAGLLVTCRDAFDDCDLLCFVHDKRSHKQETSFASGRDYRRLLFDNLLGSRNLVNRVLRAFDEDESLGLLAPPAPWHGVYFSAVGREWTENLDATNGLLRRIGATTQVTADDTPFGLGSAFWCRTSALRKLSNFDWTYDDFPAEPVPDDGTLSHALERSFVFVAQDAGYYSATVMTNAYAAMAVTRADAVVRETNRILAKGLRYHIRQVTDYFGYVDSLVKNTRQLAAIAQTLPWRASQRLSSALGTLRSVGRRS